jgi:flavoprotein
MAKAIKIDEIKVFTLQAKLNKRSNNEFKAIKKHHGTNNTNTTIKLIHEEYERLDLAPHNSNAELEEL